MKLLITGTFRSSTTLLGRILNVSDNLQVFTDLTCYSRFHNFNISNKREIIDEIISRIKERRNYTIKSKLLNLIETKNHFNAVDLWFDILNSLDKRNEKKYCGEKIVLEWRNIRQFLNQNKYSKVFHTIRDPRSVLVSWKKMTNSPEPRYIDSIFNCIDSMDTALLLEKDFPTTKYQVFNYDEFIKKPEVYIQELCSKFGINYSDKMIDSSNWKLDGKEYTHSSMHGKITDFSGAKSRSWKNYITIEEEFIFNKVFPDHLLEKFNFEPKREINFSKVNYSKIEEIFNDGFLIKSLTDLLFLNKGQSRFPSDFRDPSTWMKPFFE